VKFVQPPDDRPNGRAEIAAGFVWNVQSQTAQLQRAEQVTVLRDLAA